jgi:hypothetical protein
LNHEVVCPVANISRKGRIRRAVLGSLVLAGTIAVLAGTWTSLAERTPGTLPWARLGAVPFLFFAALCLFQANAST